MQAITARIAIYDGIVLIALACAGRRQQLLREQGVLDMLVSMTVLPHSHQDIEYKELYAGYKNKDPKYQNIFTLCRLAIF